ncbi:MAG TPA: hypothetical protein VGB51_02610 [Actinomycetota bacterium]
MRFEIFDGPSTVAIVDFDPPAGLRLRLRQSEHRAFLIEYFAGEPADIAGDTLELVRDDWSPVEFEQAVMELRRLRALQVVSRPAASED